MKFLAKLSSLF